MVCHAGRADLENNGCPVRPFSRGPQVRQTGEENKTKGDKKWMLTPWDLSFKCFWWDESHIYVDMPSAQLIVTFFFIVRRFLMTLLLNAFFFRSIKHILSFILRHFLPNLPRVGRLQYTTTGLYNWSYLMLLAWLLYLYCLYFLDIVVN